MNDLGSHSSRSVKLKKLEKAWNNSLSSGHESRRIAQMTEDIKHFIVRSMSDPAENRRFAENYQRERLQNSTDTFSTIANTLRFTHHEGTDHNMELRVIKVIMIREGILMSLKYSAEMAERQGNLQGNNLLELMSQFRESTLNYLEYLCLWRQSAQSETGETQPRAFIWENQNYTMKLISDLDFLSENPVVIECLNLTQGQLRSNPLMLSNNLEDLNTWMAPEERAAADVQGKTNSSEFQTRLRLRYAERILLQEMELHNFEGSQIFMTQDNGEQHNSPEDIMMITGTANQQVQNVMIGSNVLENEFDFDPNMASDENPEFIAIMHQQQSLFSPERRVKTTEGSNRTTDFSQPQSRASTITNGFLSAPSTSHGSRGHFANPQSGIPVNSAGGMVPIDYGHDFFTGNWGDGASSDAFPFFSEVSLPQEENGQYPQQQIGENSNRMALDDDEDGEEEVLYTESSQAQNFESYKPMNDNVPYGRNAVGIAEDEDNDQNSIRSIESVSDGDMRVLSGLFVPPKVVNLAGAVAVILLSKGNEIPMDASWPAFLRLMKRPGFADNMNGLTPSRVPKFKLLAVQPMLDQVFYDERANHDEYSRKQMSFQELIAVTKLMNWVRQFSEAEAKVMHSRDKVSKQKLKKKKTLVSPFKMPPGALAPLSNAHSTSQTSGVNNSSSGIRKNHATPIPLAGAAGEQNLLAKEKMKSSRVKEKTALVQLARKQADERRQKSETKKNMKGEMSQESLPGSKTRKKQPIPKVQLDIVPFHEEKLDNVYAHPVQVTLLTSPDALDVKEASLSDNEDDEDNYSEDDEVVEDGKEAKPATNKGDKKKDDNQIKYVIPSIPKTSIEQTRLVIKIHDTKDSKDATTYINMREYQLFLQDLPEKLTAPKEEVDMFFQPFDLKWWANNIGKVIVVNASGGGGNKSLKVSIGKQKIEEHVRMQIVNLHRLPMVGGKRQTFSTPRRSIVHPSSSASGSVPTSASANNSARSASPVPPVSANTSIKETVSTKDTITTTVVKDKQESQKKVSLVAVEEVQDDASDAKYQDDASNAKYQDDADFVTSADDSHVGKEDTFEAAAITTEESVAYGDDFEETAKPQDTTVDLSAKEKNWAAQKSAQYQDFNSHVDYLEESFVDSCRSSSASVQKHPPTESFVPVSEGDSRIAMGSMLIEEVPPPSSSVPTVPIAFEEEAIEDNFPELKPPSRITSTRTSVDIDAIQRQMSLKESGNIDTVNAISTITPDESKQTQESKQMQDAVTEEGPLVDNSLYGSDFEHAQTESVSDLPVATPLKSVSKGDMAEDVDNSLVFEVSANSIPHLLDGKCDEHTAVVDVNTAAKTVVESVVSVTKADVVTVEDEEEGNDDGIDDDLSETAQAPIDRSMSMSASMRISASFNHGTSNPPSSMKAAVQDAVLEPEEDDHSLYNILDDDD